jgi:hypothetical protein
MRDIVQSTANTPAPARARMAVRTYSPLRAILPNVGLMPAARLLLPAFSAALTSVAALVRVDHLPLHR